MTTPLWCLVFFAVWTHLIVVGGIGAFRVSRVLTGKDRPDAFPADTPHGPGWYRRLMRAHMNCVENLPVFGALIVVAHLIGLTEGTMSTLAIAAAAGRVAQTISHVSSGRSMVVNIRFGFYLVQLGAAAGMVALIAQRGLAG